MRPKQNYYDQGEKPGRPTAWRIKQQRTERTITAIEDANRNRTVYPLVLKSFMIAINEDRQAEFLDKLPKISEETKNTLQLNTAGIPEATGALKSG